MIHASSETPTRQHQHQDTRIVTVVFTLSSSASPLPPRPRSCCLQAVRVRGSGKMRHVATCVLSCVCVLYRRSIASCCLGISPSLLGQSTDAYLAPPHVYTKCEKLSTKIHVKTPRQPPHYERLCQRLCPLDPDTVHCRGCAREGQA